MKNILLALFSAIGITAVVFAVYNLEPSMHSTNSTMDDIIYGFERRKAKVLEKKYQMRLSGIGGGVKDKKIWLMTLSFTRDDSLLSENEARKLLIACINEYLDAVNRDEYIRPYLKDFPTTSRNLDFSIHHHQKNGFVAHYPYISVVNCNQGKIGFFTKDPAERYGYKTKKYETFEEAVAIVQKENASS